MRTLKPLGNRVVIKRAAVESTKGGILLPDSAQEKPKMGEVIAVGPGKLNDSGHLTPMHVKVGDKVLFTKYAGSSTNLEGMFDEETLVMSEDDIMAIITH
jgi:chaperonin GroES